MDLTCLRSRMEQPRPKSASHRKWPSRNSRPTFIRPNWAVLLRTRPGQEAATKQNWCARILNSRVTEPRRERLLALSDSQDIPNSTGSSKAILSTSTRTLLGDGLAQAAARAKPRTDGPVIQLKDHFSPSAGIMKPVRSFSIASSSRS